MIEVQGRKLKNIRLIDADFLNPSGRVSPFPNLALMKLSTFLQKKEDTGYIFLLDSYEFMKYPELGIDEFYISKVFSKTEIPQWVLDDKRVKGIGGTGFFFDKAPFLPHEIEHCKPDYSLYSFQLDVNGAYRWKKTKEWKKQFTDYSIGFLTRGCFRKCPFCVNKRYVHSFKASPLEEFLDKDRKKIMLLDDNFLSYPNWKEEWQKLVNTGKRFFFKQGLDIRLIDEEAASILFADDVKYDGAYTFAFDSIRDKDLIIEKLEIICRFLKNKEVTFYILTGYEGTDLEDIENLLKRIHIIKSYGLLPYVMKYRGPDNIEPYQKSRYREWYISIARWCNQFRFRHTSFYDFCNINQSMLKTNKTCVALKSLREMEREIPDLVKKYLI